MPPAGHPQGSSQGQVRVVGGGGSTLIFPSDVTRRAARRRPPRRGKGALTGRPPPSRTEFAARGEDPSSPAVWADVRKCGAARHLRAGTEKAPASSGDDRHTQGMERVPKDEHLLAIGRVAQASSSLEMYLRILFCTLVDSKYAAIVAGGQSANWLIENSTAVFNVHSDLGEDDRAIFKDLLIGASAAYRSRNRYIHDAWVTGSNRDFPQLRSKPKSYKLDHQSVSIEQVNGTADELTACGATILREVFRVSGQKVGLGVQLSWEDHLDGTMPPEQIVGLVARKQRAAKIDVASIEPDTDGEADTNR